MGGGGGVTTRHGKTASLFRPSDLRSPASVRQLPGDRNRRTVRPSGNGRRLHAHLQFCLNDRPFFNTQLPVMCSPGYIFYIFSKKCCTWILRAPSLNPKLGLMK